MSLSFLTASKNRSNVSIRNLTILLLVFSAVRSANAQTSTPATLSEQFTTQERVQRSKWWPTSGKAARSDYAGAEACGECHDSFLKSQAQHLMARTSASASTSPILRSHVAMPFRVDGYDYQVTGDSGNNLQYEVKESGNKSTGQLTWAFGAGKVGQSYLSQEGESYREIRFSYFSNLNEFDVTPNQFLQTVPTIQKAAGRLLSEGEARRCFGCHTTASTVGNTFDPGKAMPGVSCEGCHGPGAKHVSEMKAGNLEGGLAAITNPSQLKPVDAVDFCGACHTTWWDAKEIGANGIANVRFQPYRLESSRCWSRGDARLACFACHDPHQPLVKDAGYYDSKCLSCHANRLAKTQAQKLAGCPVATKDCVTCHMKKYEVKNMHFKYTDHRIGITKADAGFPE
jgi:hypothetical protein